MASYHAWSPKRTCSCCSRPNVGNIALRISDFVDPYNRNQDSLRPHTASTEVAMNSDQDPLISPAQSIVTVVNPIDTLLETQSDHMKLEDIEPDKPSCEKLLNQRFS